MIICIWQIVEFTPWLTQLHLHTFWIIAHSSFILSISSTRNMFINKSVNFLCFEVHIFLESGKQPRLLHLTMSVWMNAYCFVRTVAALVVSIRTDNRGRSTFTFRPLGYERVYLSLYKGEIHLLYIRGRKINEKWSTSTHQEVPLAQFIPYVHKTGINFNSLLDHTNRPTILLKTTFSKIKSAIDSDP